MEEEATPNLPLDIIYQIPKYISDPASLARADSSCKIWRGVIRDSAFLDGLTMRHLDHGFTSSLLIGFFYQDSAESPEHLWQHHKDKTRCLAPSFIPMPELLPSTNHKEGYNSARPLSLGTFIHGIGSSLNFYEPVVSQDSFLVLCRHSKDPEGNSMADVVRVCNPLTGEVFQLPDLPYIPPNHYVLLVANDNSLDGCMTQSFQLVAIWISGKRIKYVYYCSKTKSWWVPSSFPEVMAGLYLVSTPVAASHGSSIHWLCGCWKSWSLSHVVSLHVNAEELSYLELPSEVKRNKAPLLGNSADGALLLLIMKGLHMSMWKHKTEPGNGNGDWVRFETIDMTSFLPMRVLKMHSGAKIRLEIFRGKSGAVVLWIQGEGIFLFTLSDRSMRKIDNEHLTKKYRFCPYEIDWLSCLAVTNLVIDGSLPLDVEREKARRRWRILVAKNCTQKAKSTKA
ncbi:hypothetical protein HU200_012972 [Digitaria exilis]|uniref:DUF7595 domain-containing protein n=1 Tax=Digitaria exilis TaxID=1010633 RepID=A0A835KLE2_9POAL|nr:hypothetical protein HU200_012972 [Digitaria exilis]